MQTFGRLYYISLLLFIFTAVHYNSCFAEGVWEHYTSTYSINDIAVKGDDVWYATDGGVVHRNVATGTYRKYTEEDGLADNKARKIAIDVNGIVWTISDYSLSCFDGSKWEKVPDGDRFSENNITMLKIDNTGKIWIDGNKILSVYNGQDWVSVEIPEIFSDFFNYNCFTIDNENGVWISAEGHGIIHYNGSEWLNYTKENGLPSNRIYALETAPDGGVWVAFSDMDSNAGYYKDKKWTFFTGEDGIDSSIYSFTFGSDNKVWAGSSNYIYLYEDSTWGKYKFDGISSSGLYADDSGRIWTKRFKRELCCYDMENWTFYSEPPGLCNNYVCNLVKSPDGKLWIGTGFGFSVFDGVNWEPYINLINEFSDKRTDHITFLSDGRIGLGIGGYFAIYENKEWKTFYIGELLASSINGTTMVKTITEGKDGIIWVGTYAGLYYYKDSNFVKVESPEIRTIYSAIYDKKGNLWIGCSNGVYLNNGISWKKMGNDDPVAEKNVRQLLITREGNLWIAGLGVSFYDGIKWTPYTKDNGFPFVLCDTIKEDSIGVVWFGVAEGVANFDGTTFHKFSDSDGISSQGFGGYKINSIQNIMVSPSNDIWVSALDGHYIYKNGHFEKIIENKGYLPSSSILFDKNGVLWVGTGSGLFKYTPDSVIDTINNTVNLSPFTLNGNYPNPFNPNTTISFSFGKESPVEIAVYNISGQKVKTLFSGKMSAGNQVAVWDGRDEKGQPVSSGVYFARMKSGVNVESCKMMLLR